MAITGASLTEVAEGLSDIIAGASAARMRAQEAVELLNKAYKQQDQLCTYAYNIGNAWSVRDTIVALAELPKEIATVEGSLVEKETELSTLKFHDLREAEENYEMAVLNATMEAQANEVLNGKNAEIRKRQKEAYLANDEEVQIAKATVQHFKSMIGALEGEIALLKVDAHKFANQFKGVCHAATLKVEMLRIMGRAAID